MSDLLEARVPDIGSDAGVPIIEILVKVGDMIKKDQSLLTLESDKATMEVPSSVEGKVVEILVKLGDEITTGALVARIEASAADVKQSKPAVEDTPVAKAETVKTESTPKPVPAVARDEPSREVTFKKSPTHSIDSSELVPGNLPYASPSVRLFARELGVDLSQVSGTERGGRIVKEDVQKFVKSALSGGVSTGAVASGNGLSLIPWPQVDFSKFGPIQHQPLSRIQKLSGANLARNWAMIPHVTQFDEADITEMEAFRKQLGTEQKDVKITPLVFLIKASVAALKKFPTFNASLEGENLVLKDYYHVGIAVDTPDGLVVPVIRDCDQKGLLELSQELAQISVKAREKKLTANDMQGGCFTISSLGGIGGTAFTPIINAPEVAILGVSKAQMKPVWNGSEFKPKLMLPLSLSYDHRVIDGASAARFTAYMAQVLTDLRRLLV
jgi:pyruvate dehydrogenase E2 component (dihydrolipoamide acetyltransferase)